jgi:hypothetical protein
MDAMECVSCIALISRQELPLTRLAANNGASQHNAVSLSLWLTKFVNCARRAAHRCKGDT